MEQEKKQYIIALIGSLIIIGIGIGFNLGIFKI